MTDDLQQRRVEKAIEAYYANRCENKGITVCIAAALAAADAVVREAGWVMVKRGALHAESGRKPTIAELEAILNSKDDMSVEIMPDGSIRAVAREPTEGGGE